MKKLTIFIDMDGTIEDLLSVWLKRLNKMSGKDIKPEDIKDWNMCKAYPFLSYNDIHSVLKEDTIWGEIEPIENAATVLKYFMDCGHNVYLVTATSYFTVKPKVETLIHRCFPFISWRQVIIMDNKQLLNGDVMIDDAIHNLERGSYKKVLFDAPYNRDYPAEEHGMIRGKNWIHIKEIIDEMAKE